MPYDYSYPDSAIDPFAQTAGTDDLFFDDDFVPVAEPVVEQNPVETRTPDIDDAPPPAGLAQSQHIPRGPANGERGRGGRGRGRGGRGRGRGAIAQNNETRDVRQTKEKKEEAPTPEVTEPTTTTDDATAETPATPSGPKEPKPPTSVRGDRTLTGGPKRSRLTEEELSAKLAAMRSKNETLQAEHAKAEADQASFEAREAEAAKQTAARKKHQAERQKVDRQNRQQMMGEREQNRQRKLGALHGREWDAEKEEGFSGTGEERRRGAARGAHGGVVRDSRPAPADNSPDDFNIRGTAEGDDTRDAHTQRGRGRGRGRGGRGGRGGRSDHQGGPPAKKDDQRPPQASDFPDLPQAATSAPKDTEAPKKLDFPIKTKVNDVKNSEQAPDRPGVKKQESFGLGSPTAAGGSWADQVEGS